MKVFLEILFENHLSEEEFEVFERGNDRRRGFERLIDDLLRGESLIRLSRLFDGSNHGESNGSYVHATNVLGSPVMESFRDEGSNSPPPPGDVSTAQITMLKILSSVTIK